jgi:hypothetical protein
MVGTTPLVGRNARFYRAGVAVAYAKSISVDLSAEVIKDYSMDAAAPALLASGNQTFTWSVEKLYVGEEWATLLLAGTVFDVVFAPKGTSPVTSPYLTLSNCIVSKVGSKAGMASGILLNVSGEAKSVTPTDT